ncbi:MAG: alpha/beta hydrolase [Trueperella sp.]|nr:alpha/beta hydrolase [Trueperella sp.]
MITWEPDELLPGYYACTLELPELISDTGKPKIATLVRGAKIDHPKFAVLMVHGWNDYFYQTEFAEEIVRLGGACYGIDLHNYGRSHQDGELWGYTEDLTDYDADIAAARHAIRVDCGEVPLVLYGHSTGGLTTCLWANRNRGKLAGLILNSPWIEWQGATLVRQLGQPLVGMLAKTAPTRVLPNTGNGFYQRTIAHWNQDPRYRHPNSFPVRPGWLNAIFAGHAEVAAGLDIDCPILTITSKRSLSDDEWDERMRRADTVLDVEQVWKRVPGLGDITTLVKLDDAVHDVILSQEPVRKEAYRHIERFLAAIIPTR